MHIAAAANFDARALPRLGTVFATLQTVPTRTVRSTGEQDGNLAAAQNTLCDAPQEKMPNAARASCPDYEQVRL